MEFQSQVGKDEDEEIVPNNIKAEPSRLEARYSKRNPSVEDTVEKEVSSKKCDSDMACTCYPLNRSRSADDFLFSKDVCFFKINFKYSSSLFQKCSTYTFTLSKKEDII